MNRSILQKSGSHANQEPILKWFSVFMLICTLYLPSCYAVPLWLWGVETDYGICPASYTKPVGLLGAIWFNFSASWTENYDVKFANWDKPYFLINGICFEGSIASIMQFYKWPDRSQLKGPLVGGEFRYIDHAWQYSQIAPPGLDPEADDVYARELSGCTTTEYCTAVDEIRRLFIGAHLASYWWDKPGEWPINNNNNNLHHALKNRLGFVNAQLISPTDPNLISLLTNEFSQGRPVIEYSSGHAKVEDGYKIAQNGSFAVHILDGSVIVGSAQGCMRRHPAYYEDFSGTQREWFIIGLDPTVTIPTGVAPVVRSFVFGNAQQARTSGTLQQKRFHIAAAPGNTASGSILINVKSYLFNQNTNRWEFNQTLVGMSGNLPGPIETDFFSFSVPDQDSIKLEISIQSLSLNTTGKIRMVLDDTPISSLIFNKAGLKKMEIVEDGTCFITGAPVEGPMPSESFLFQHQLRPASFFLDPPGNLGCLHLQDNDGGEVLNLPSYLRGSAGFFWGNRAQMITNSNNEWTTVRGAVTQIKPIELGAIASQYNFKDDMHIRWRIQNGASINFVNILYKNVLENNWIVIENGGNIPASDGEKIWMRMDRLSDVTIRIKVENAEDPSVFTECSHDIAIVEKIQSILSPAQGAFLKVGQSTTINWNFDPPANVEVQIGYDGPYGDFAPLFPGNFNFPTVSCTWTPTLAGPVWLRIEEDGNYRWVISEELTVNP